MFLSTRAGAIPRLASLGQHKEASRMTGQKNVLYGMLDGEYVTITRGEGVYVYDEAGTRYLDAASGVCVVNIGHGVPEVVEAISRQASQLAFTYGGLVDNRPRQELAARLQEWAPAGMGETKTLFVSGGAEANEGAFKIAYQYHWERGHPTRRKMIGRWQSYHGNTIATLSMSGRTTWRSMPTVLLMDFPHISPPYCYRCPWGQTYPGCGLPCAHELRRVIQQEGPESIAGFIAEPVVGTSMSAVVPPPEYYPIIREICDEYDVLFIVDEVMSGIGRTGARWGIDHWGVTPDIITSSKGLAGGYAPLGAVILSEKVWTPIAQGSRSVLHSCTYGGNPLSCAAGVAVLDYIDAHDLVSRAGQMGDRLLARLRAGLADNPYVGDIRGKGLFAGIELVRDRATKKPFPLEMDLGFQIELEAIRRGLILLAGVTGLVDGVAGDHLELVPPYTIEDEQIEFIVQTLRAVIPDVISRYAA
jgi:adenosylmethionine-8-amino-7-oxononanoate aminotransferase